MPLKCVHLSDTHDKHLRINWDGIDLNEIDVIIHSGDFSSVGYQGEVTKFFQWFASLPVKYKLLVAGNHDKCFDPKFWQKNDPADRFPVDKNAHKWTKTILKNYRKNPNHHFLMHESVTIEGVNFFGSPWSNWFHGLYWGFNAKPGEESLDLYAQVPEGTDVLITHGPPLGKLDYTSRFHYAGSQEMRDRIDVIKPQYSLFGHIHESYGETFDGTTTFLNSAILNLEYEPDNLPQVFEI